MDKEAIVRVEKRTKQRGPGRPRSYPLMPANDEVAEVMRRRKRHVGDDGLVAKVDENPDSLDVLDALMRNFAHEASGLDFDREQALRKDADTATYSSKRVTALKALSDTWFKKRDMVLEETFDFSSRKFQVLFQFWLQKWRRVAKRAGLGEEEIQNFFKVAVDVFDGWEDEAMQYIKTHV